VETVALDPLSAEFVRETLVPDGDLAARGQVKSQEAEHAGGDADGIGVKFLVEHPAGLDAIGGEPRLPCGVVILDLPDQIADLAEVSLLGIGDQHRRHGAIEACL
jgi:hypothetical protein